MKIKNILLVIDAHRGTFNEQKDSYLYSTTEQYFQWMKNVELTEEGIRKYFSNIKRDWNKAVFKDYSYIVDSELNQPMFMSKEGTTGSTDTWVVGTCNIPVFTHGEILVLDTVVFSKKNI